MVLLKLVEYKMKQLLYYLLFLMLVTGSAGNIWIAALEKYVTINGHTEETKETKLAPKLNQTKLTKTS